jgi:hypothetical protein
MGFAAQAGAQGPTALAMRRALPLVRTSGWKPLEWRQKERRRRGKRPTWERAQRQAGEERAA